MNEFEQTLISTIVGIVLGFLLSLLPQLINLISKRKNLYRNFIKEFLEASTYKVFTNISNPNDLEDAINELFKTYASSRKYIEFLETYFNIKKIIISMEILNKNIFKLKDIFDNVSLAGPSTFFKYQEQVIRVYEETIISFQKYVEMTFVKIKKRGFPLKNLCKKNPSQFI